MQWQIGVDEAGRGALAGPVSVGAVLYPSDFDWKATYQLVTRRGEPQLRDSKKLSPQQREILYEHIVAHGRLHHAFAFVSAETIDAIGISNAAREAAAMVVTQLGVLVPKVQVLLDAGLSVSAQWEQESFVRGDENIPAIALASIIAKVSRDRYMDELALVHGSYGFDSHKGYGTLTHRQAIRRNGSVPLIHRQTFLSNIV